MTVPDKYSADGIKKQLISITAQRPSVVYPAAVGFMAVAYVVAIDASLIAAGLAAAGVSISMASGAFEYFVRGEKNTIEILRLQREELVARKEIALKNISKELENFNDSVAIEQLKKIKEKFINFVSVLDKKFKPSELTYNRYLSIAEQVYLNAIDNLEIVIIARQSVSAIDSDHIEDQISKLSEDDPVYVTLLERKALLEKQSIRIKKILQDNELAMTKIDMVSIKLSEITTQSSQALMDMDFAMNELQSLIDRADKFSNN